MRSRRQAALILTSLAFMPDKAGPNSEEFIELWLKVSRLLGDLPQEKMRG